MEKQKLLPKEKLKKLQPRLKQKPLKTLQQKRKSGQSERRNCWPFAKTGSHQSTKMMWRTPTLAITADSNWPTRKPSHECEGQRKSLFWWQERRSSMENSTWLELVSLSSVCAPSRSCRLWVGLKAVWVSIWTTLLALMTKLSEWSCWSQQR